MLLNDKMIKNESQRKLVEYRKKQGLCIRCGQKLDRDGVHCTKCREKINQTTQERRKWYLSHKICPQCGKNDLMGDETVCPECRAKAVNRITKKRKRDDYNLKHREWAKSAYQKRKEQGICTRCGKRPATKGMSTCAMCREKSNETRRIRRGCSDRSDRINQGICYFCDLPVKNGYKVCENHYQMILKIGEKGREVQKLSGDWKWNRKIIFNTRGDCLGKKSGIESQKKD